MVASSGQVVNCNQKNAPLLFGGVRWGVVACAGVSAFAKQRQEILINKADVCS